MRTRGTSHRRVSGFWSPLVALLLLLLLAGPARPEARVLRVADVEIDGAWKTREAVVLHLLGLRPGDLLDPERLLAGQDRLRRSGFFHEVEIRSRPGAERGEVILELALKERHRPYLDTGFGYRDTGGWYLNLLSLRSENTLGLGDRNTLGLQLGFRSAGVVLDSWTPLHPDASWALRLRLSALGEQRLWYQEEAQWDGLYDEYRLGLDRNQADLALEWRPLERLRLSAGLSSLSLEPKAEGENRDTGDAIPLEELPAPIAGTQGKSLLHGLSLGLLLGGEGMDGRPGASLRLNARLVDEALGARRSFQRWTLALSGCRRLRPGHDLALGLRAGLMGGDAPWHERFHLGGTYSLRGFRDHSLSPLDGHGSFWTTSGEYRFPLASSARTRLGGVIFLDAGRGGGLPEGSSYEVDYEALQVGLGYGIRLEIPWAGVLGFDVGFPVTRGVTGESVWYYLTLGHSF